MENQKESNEYATGCFMGVLIGSISTAFLFVFIIQMIVSSCSDTEVPNLYRAKIINKETGLVQMDDGQYTYVNHPIVISPGPHKDGDYVILRSERVPDYKPYSEEEKIWISTHPLKLEKEKEKNE